MSTQVDPSHNITALLVGTGEFSFCEGATSASDAKLKGYRDVGNIKVFKPSTEAEKIEHFGSYRGVLRKDKTIVNKSNFDYTITCDEWNQQLLLLLFGAERAASKDFTQSLNATAAISFAFTSSLKADPTKWYDIYIGSNRARFLNSITKLTGPAVSVTADSSTDKITETAHGRLAGSKVIFGGTAPSGLTAGTVYYVRDVTANDYKVAATSGGSAIDLTTNGTSVTAQTALEEGSDFECDLRLGRVKFAAEQDETLSGTVDVPAVADGDAKFLAALTPMVGLTKSGYGRITCFDQDSSNKVVFDHVDFACEVTVDSSGEVDGQNPTEIVLKVTIGSDAGTLYIREANQP